MSRLSEIEAACPWCNGTGQVCVNRVTCSSCHGTGDAEYQPQFTWAGVADRAFYGLTAVSEGEE